MKYGLVVWENDPKNPTDNYLWVEKSGTTLVEGPANVMQFDQVPTAMATGYILGFTLFCVHAVDEIDAECLQRSREAQAQMIRETAEMEKANSQPSD